MRRLRPQISLKNLLLAIAIVATNFAAYRCLLGEQSRNGLRVVFAILPEEFVLGVIPLLDVAMIGTLFCVVTRLRALRRARQVGPRSRLAGITFFSVHFLAIGCVAAIFMPEAIEIKQLADVIPQAWLRTLGEWARSFPEVMLDCVILGVWFSGPPLVLSWIGGLLAKRSAARMSARRFRALAGMVSFGFASIALSIWMTPRPVADDQDVDLEFRVVDRESSQPIAGVTLRLTDAFNRFSTPQCALTTANGRARLTARLPAEGAKTAFWTIGSFSPWGRWLEVAAPRYKTTLIPLPEVLGAHVDLRGPRIHRVVLVEGTSPTDRFADVAGDYFKPGGQHGGFLFRLAPDGRFVYSVGPLQYGEYGRLTRNGGSFDLVPIPHPGVPMNPLMAKQFRIVQWDECAYFTVADDAELTSFCRASLTPNHPRNDGAPPYCRESDLEKPRTGLPRLPARVWVKFLFQEASLRNQNGLLRLGIERMFRYRTNPGIPRTAF